MRLGPQVITVVTVTSLILVFCLVALVTALLPPKIVILVLASTATFFLTLLRVEAGLIILIFMVPWTLQYEIAEFSGAPFEVGSDDVLILCIIFGWLGFLAIHKEPIFPHSPLNWPIGAFFAVALLSQATFFADKSRGASLAVGLHLLKWFEYTLVYFVAFRVINNWEKAKGFLYLSLASAMIVAIVQICLMATKQYTGITYTPQGIVYWTLPGFESNGILGAYYVLFIGIALAFIVNSESRLMQGLLIGYSVLLSYCLFFTFSRAAYVGLVAAMIVISVWSARVLSRIPLIIFMVGIASLVFLLEPVMSRITMTVDLGGPPTLETSAYERWLSWRFIVPKVLTENPLNAILGIGFWGSRFHGAFGFSTPHNWYLALLLETGIFGLGVFCWLMKRIIHNAVSLHQKAQDNVFAESLAVGYIAGLVGLLVHAFFGETFESFRVLGPFWFLTGIVMAAVMIQEEDMTRQIAAAATVPVPKKPSRERVLAATHTKQFIKRFFE